MKEKTKQRTKESALKSLEHFAGGLLGMIAGSAVGRFSLLAGAATILGGTYFKRDWITSAGVGMVASNGFTGKQPDGSVTGVDGFQEEMENAKHRAISSLKALGKKVYLDKLSPSLGKRLGLGALEDSPMVFVGSQVAHQGDFDTSEVDAIIRQLEEGQPIQGGSEIAGTELHGQIGNLDIQELNGTEDVLELNAVA